MLHSYIDLGPSLIPSDTSTIRKLKGAICKPPLARAITLRAESIYSPSSCEQGIERTKKTLTSALLDIELVIRPHPYENCKLNDTLLHILQ